MEATMNRTIRKVIALILCVLTLVPNVALSTLAAPAKATNIELTYNSGKKQELAWSKVSGADGYAVYKSVRKNGEYKRLGFTSKNEYTVEELKTATTYYYKVRAFEIKNGKRDYGPYSVPFQATTIGKVTKLKAASAGVTYIKLKWDGVKKASGYFIYQKVGDNWEKVGETSSTAFTVKDLKKATAYSFRVSSFIITDDKIFESAPRSAKFMTAPSKIGKIELKSSGSQSVTLEWSKKANVTGYEVYMYNSENERVLVAKTGSNSYKVENLDPLSAYAFSVRAYSVRYNAVYGEYSDDITVFTRPVKVKGLKATGASASSIKFSWNEHKQANGYEIQQYNYETNKWEKLTTTVKTSYTVKGLTSGDKVKIRVRAYVIFGSEIINSLFGDSVTAAIAPGIPQNITSALNSNDGVSLKWDAVEGATGYQVYYYNAHDGAWEKLAVTPKAYYNHNRLTETKQYMYKVRAYITGTNEVYYGEFSDHTEIDYVNTEGSDDANLVSVLEKIEFLNFSPEESAFLEKGFLSYLYDPLDGYYYTASDPWQRNVGYTIIFDLAAPFTIMWYDTMRIKFEYDNLKWMVQVWKGQYGWIFKGAEIGVYTMPLDRKTEWYDCASDEHSLKMSFDFYYDGDYIFSRPYGTYWWCTGFVPGMNYINHDRIRMDNRITMKDYDMLKVFCEALEKEGYVKDLTYTVDGLDVYFKY